MKCFAVSRMSDFVFLDFSLFLLIGKIEKWHSTFFEVKEFKNATFKKVKTKEMGIN